MKVLIDVLEVLMDCEWHDRKDLMDKTGLSLFSAKLIMTFLLSYGFCQSDWTGRIKIKQDVFVFFKELDRVEKET